MAGGQSHAKGQSGRLSDQMVPPSSSIEAAAAINVTARPLLHPPKHPAGYIRGVNLGGWLLAERFITPYLFALTSCDLEGDFCSYPGQASGPRPGDDGYLACSDATLNCRPVRTSPARLGRSRPDEDLHRLDYPVSEFDIVATFPDRKVARHYMERHWDTFLTRRDLVRLRNAGVTHLRVPFGYWVRGNIAPGEPWAEGGWHYFRRLVKWCREIGGLQVWADLHGAPGSENGFDNSGHYLRRDSCLGWSDSPENVARTLDVIEDVAKALRNEGLLDVVTGLGLLNEPFVDCDVDVLRKFYNDGHDMVRNILGPNIAIFVSDQFKSSKWNDSFWTDPKTHSNTYLDTHPYHVFFEKGRSMSPRQHIEYVCQYNTKDVRSCCYEDAPNNTVVSRGLGRVVGEWSAAVDVLPTELELAIMNSIAANGTAILLDRELGQDRRRFLRNFVESQMVAYEDAEVGRTSGWMFWNFKMEGSAFIEWDFLRGIEEGWIPALPSPQVSSVDIFGSCYDIAYRTNDSYALIDEYPKPQDIDWSKWQGWDIDDDFVLSDGGKNNVQHDNRSNSLFVIIVLMMTAALVAFRRGREKKRDGYDRIIESAESASCSKTAWNC